MPRKTFENRQELLKLLSEYEWSDGRGGKGTERMWQHITIKWFEGDKEKQVECKTPAQVTIFLDRFEGDNFHGSMYVHSPLNSYLGFNPKLGKNDDVKF
jgi:hypothetical protein